MLTDDEREEIFGHPFAEYGKVYNNNIAIMYVVLMHRTPFPNSHLLTLEFKPFSQAKVKNFIELKSEKYSYKLYFLLKILTTLDSRKVINLVQIYGQISSLIFPPKRELTVSQQLTVRSDQPIIRQESRARD